MCERVIERARGQGLLRMQREAEELGVRKGVGWLLVIELGRVSYPALLAPSILVLGGFLSESDPEREGDAAANHFNLAASMIGEMFETGEPSGASNRPPRKGEWGLKGGYTFCSEDGTAIFAAFYGDGTDEQHYQIARKAGTEVLTYLGAESFAQTLLGCLEATTN